MNVARLVILLSFFIHAGVCAAVSHATPEQLASWTPWVKADLPEIDCPWMAGQQGARQCVWPGRLQLELHSQGMGFALDVEVYSREALVALPGDQGNWPLAISVDGKPAPVVEHNQLPHLALAAGSYKIKGIFAWSRPPGQLGLPASIALVSLSRDGQSVSVDRRDQQLIFSGASSAVPQQSRDSLAIEVYRKMSDGIPVTLETQVKLFVSGKPREISFGKVLLAESKLIELRSPVPVRIEANGDMRAQVAAGEHVIHLLTRFSGNPESIALQQPSSAEWPADEYLSFQAATEIRQVKLSGAPSVDTSRISLPAKWADLPTYRLNKDNALKLATEYRGDHAPAANEFNVQRDLWLGFDGGGLTALDRVSGRMQQQWRLNAAADTDIGRATVDQEPVLITEDRGRAGIEIRSPSINLEAVTRTGAISGFSAIGWDVRAASYSATLHLPPGWRVLHASGVDEIRGTWISHWDLWDIFLLLIIVAATRKLFNNSTAVLAAVTYVLALHEPGAPLLFIPLLLVIIALLPLTAGWIRKLLTSLSVLIGIAFLLLFIDFAVNSFRLAIFPSLERAVVGEYSARVRTSAGYSSAPEKMLDMASEMSADSEIVGAMKSKRQRLEEAMVSAPRQAQESLYQIAEDDRVQTGPGLPSWTWNAVYLRSSGPVSAGQQLDIVYAAPWLTSLWRVLVVFALGLLVALVARRLAALLDLRSAIVSGAVPFASAGTVVAVGLLVLLGGLLPATQIQAAEFPPKYLLDEMQQRLTRPPTCLPGCVSLNQGKMNIDGAKVSLTFDVYADADIALALPGSDSNWQLLEVSQKGVHVPLARSADGVVVQLARGHHKLEIMARLSGNQVAVSFPHPIHNFQVSAEGWQVEGLVDGRIRNNTLNIRALDKKSVQDRDTLKPDPAPTFVTVRRSFEFHKQWRLQTTVQRQAPADGPISVAVALLENEQPMSDIGVVKGGRVTLQLGHAQQSASWTSKLVPLNEFRLQAATSGDYVEQWQFTPSSQWRLDYQGIPPVKRDDAANLLRPTFKPWPGEQLAVSVRRPQGVSGPTHTVESAALEYSAGKRLQKSKLTLEIRSSLGEDYPLSLPEGAEVLRVSLNGRDLNLPDSHQLKIPLQPGSQMVLVEFQQGDDVGMLGRSPAITLPDGATNLTVSYTLPRDRWPLYISGPSIGPAMLYWGVLCVILLAAFALARLTVALRLQMPIKLSGWILLGLGLSTVNGYGVLVTAVLFFLLAARKQYIDPDSMSRSGFNLLQVVIAFTAVVTAVSVISAIPLGLLSSPEMKVVGNGSYSHLYNYYQDAATASEFPEVTVVSVPILAYRVVMLLWSLWISTKIIQWASWGWKCYSTGTPWRHQQTSAETPPQ